MRGRRADDARLQREQAPERRCDKVYLLRSFGISGHEMWDVTDPAKPVKVVTVVEGLRNTHKSYWECDTGIAYLVSGTRTWRTRRMTKIYDLSNPAKPVFIRDFGLAGQQPGSTMMPVPTELHGPISLGPKGNRVYFAYGRSLAGIMQIVDRDKLLNGPKEPTDANLLYPQIARTDLPPDAGAHTAVPLLGMTLPEFAKQRLPPDVPMPGAGHEHGDTVPLPALAGPPRFHRRDQRDDQQRMPGAAADRPHARHHFRDAPIGASSWTVPETSGNFCDRGGRFGAHRRNENFTSIYYGRVLFVTYFNAGVRALDIRDPFNPKEIGFFIPAVTPNTDKRCVGEGPTERCKVAIQTNNVEVDDRGYIYVVDRANTGLHILELSGAARHVANFPATSSN